MHKRMLAWFKFLFNTIYLDNTLYYFIIYSIQYEKIIFISVSWIRILFYIQTIEEFDLVLRCIPTHMKSKAQKGRKRKYDWRKTNKDIRGDKNGNAVCFCKLSPVGTSDSPPLNWTGPLLWGHRRPRTPRLLPPLTTPTHKEHDGDERQHGDKTSIGVFSLPSQSLL